MLRNCYRLLCVLIHHHDRIFLSRCELAVCLVRYRHLTVLVDCKVDILCLFVTARNVCFFQPVDLANLQTFQDPRLVCLGNVCGNLFFAVIDCQCRTRDLLACDVLLRNCYRLLCVLIEHHDHIDSFVTLDRAFICIPDIGDHAIFTHCKCNALSKSVILSRCLTLGQSVVACGELCKYGGRCAGCECYLVAADFKISCTARSGDIAQIGVYRVAVCIRHGIAVCILALHCFDLKHCTRKLLGAFTCDLRLADRQLVHAVLHNENAVNHLACLGCYLNIAILIHYKCNVSRDLIACRCKCFSQDIFLICLQTGNNIGILCRSPACHYGFFLDSVAAFVRNIGYIEHLKLCTNDLVTVDILLGDRNAIDDFCIDHGNLVADDGVRCSILCSVCTIILRYDLLLDDAALYHKKDGLCRLIAIGGLGFCQNIHTVRQIKIERLDVLTFNLNLSRIAVLISAEYGFCDDLSLDRPFLDQLRAGQCSQCTALADLCNLVQCQCCTVDENAGFIHLLNGELRHICYCQCIVRHCQRTVHALSFTSCIESNTLDSEIITAEFKLGCFKYRNIRKCILPVCEIDRRIVVAIQCCIELTGLGTAILQCDNDFFQICKYYRCTSILIECHTVYNRIVLIPVSITLTIDRAFLTDRICKITSRNRVVLIDCEIQGLVIGNADVAFRNSGFLQIIGTCLQEALGNIFVINCPEACILIESLAAAEVLPLVNKYILNALIAEIHLRIQLQCCTGNHMTCQVVRLFQCQLCTVNFNVFHLQHTIRTCGGCQIHCCPGTCFTDSDISTAAAEREVRRLSVIRNLCIIKDILVLCYQNIITQYIGIIRNCCFVDPVDILVLGCGCAEPSAATACCRAGLYFLELFNIDRCCIRGTGFPHEFGRVLASSVGDGRTPEAGAYLHIALVHHDSSARQKLALAVDLLKGQCGLVDIIKALRCDIRIEIDPCVDKIKIVEYQISAGCCVHRIQRKIFIRAYLTVLICGDRSAIDGEGEHIVVDNIFILCDVQQIISCTFLCFIKR